jgi:hypothetical protein
MQTKEEKNEYNRQYYVKNKELILENCKKYRKNNLEQIKKIKKTYSKSEVGKNSQRISSIKYTQKNKDRIGVRECNLEAHIRHRFLMYKNNSKKVDRVFEITEKQFTNIVKASCEYCGYISKTINGIDRLDNNIGYIFENSVACCSMCNYMKHSYTVNEYIEHCKKVTEYGENL